MVIPLRQHMSRGTGSGTRAARLRRVTWEAGSVTAAQAREAALAFLTEVDDGHAPLPDRTRDDVELVVSELVTNALRHAPGACGLQVEMGPDGHAVRVAVWDTSADAPVAQPHNGGRIGGHGLEIVQAVSRAMTVASRTAGRGKEVTAEIEIPRAPGSRSVP
jgi:anti-sigma regulatory factor (Ser/Thr protein kinase)